MKDRPVEELTNIGVTVANKLRHIGIQTQQDLKKMGSAKAYIQLSLIEPNKTLPVCYYLYSLEGAIKNKDWRTLTENTKKKLRSQAGIN